MFEWLIISINFVRDACEIAHKSLTDGMTNKNQALPQSKASTQGGTDNQPINLYRFKKQRIIMSPQRLNNIIITHIRDSRFLADLSQFMERNLFKKNGNDFRHYLVLRPAVLRKVSVSSWPAWLIAVE
jgi:hypothetical protein